MSPSDFMELCWKISGVSNLNWINLSLNTSFTRFSVPLKLTAITPNSSILHVWHGYLQKGMDIMNMLCDGRYANTSNIEEYAEILKIYQKPKTVKLQNLLRHGFTMAFYLNSHMTDIVISLDVIYNLVQYHVSISFRLN